MFMNPGKRTAPPPPMYEEFDDGEEMGDDGGQEGPQQFQGGGDQTPSEGYKTIEDEKTGSAEKIAKDKADAAAKLEINQDMLRRGVNVGFSGGEKKRNEILQMALLEPLVAILDETDSGLDIDALKVVSDGVNALRREDRAFLVITHYQRLLDYIVPDHVHVLVHGKIAVSGGKELALELEAEGYAKYLGAAA